MEFSKSASTVEQQLNLLASRGMIFDDLAHADRCLRTIGYYRLSAYWLPYEVEPKIGQTRSKSFRHDTNFQSVLNIYIFDRKLRMMLMEAIERIEIHVRSRWTNRLALEHGPHAHLKHTLFSDASIHTEQLARLTRSIARSNETFIEHFRKKYTEPYTPPLWAATELMTIGELSKWIKATTDKSVTDGVARDLGFPTRETFEGTLEALAYVRNICAHHNRLWNRRLVKRIPKIKRFKDLEYESVKGQKQPTNLIFNVLTVILVLLKNQNTDATFPRRLQELLKTTTDEQRRTMGFPDAWRDTATWTL